MKCKSCKKNYKIIPLRKISGDIEHTKIRYNGGPLN